MWDSCRCSAEACGRCARHDLKLLLAYGTISQLGFMVVLFGVGLEAATLAGCAVILAHALFKAALFMVVGIVDHGTGTRDIRRLPHLGPEWRATRIAAVVAAASMAGIPLTFGFVAKELGLESFLDGGVEGSGLVLGVIVLGSALTAAYAARFVAGLYGRYSLDPADVAPAAPVPVPARVGAHGHPTHVPGWAFLAPPLVLTALTLVFGFAPALLDGLIGSAAGALDGASVVAHLAVWHGVNAALLPLGRGAVPPVRRCTSPVGGSTACCRSARPCPQAATATTPPSRGCCAAPTGSPAWSRAVPCPSTSE